MNLLIKCLTKVPDYLIAMLRERYEHFRARCVETQPTVFNYSLINKNDKIQEKGCTEPLYGKKSRCILNIVPQEEKGQSIQIDKKCMKQRK